MSMSNYRNGQQPVSKSMLFTASAMASEEEKTDPGAFLLEELDTN